MVHLSERLFDAELEQVFLASVEDQKSEVIDYCKANRRAWLFTSFDITVVAHRYRGSPDIRDQ
jgi:hypothetical protein